MAFPNVPLHLVVALSRPLFCVPRSLYDDVRVRTILKEYDDGFGFVYKTDDLSFVTVCGYSPRFLLSGACKFVEIGNLACLHAYVETSSRIAFIKFCPLLPWLDVACLICGERGVVV